MLFDTHCHLNFEVFDMDREETIWRAENIGVEGMLVVGAGRGVEGNIYALSLANKFDSLWASVGVHPHDAKDVDDQSLSNLGEMAVETKVVAWGEIGLDFHYDHSPRDVQVEIFQKQLKLADEVELPVIIHDRDAHEEIKNILEKFFTGRKKERPVGIMHCFSGDLELAKHMIKIGFLISIPGVITFPNAKKLTEVVKGLPLEYMVLETDSPFLTPAPHRGKRNEPSYIIHTAKKVAEIKKLTLEDVSRVTTMNARIVFGLGGAKREPLVAYPIRGNLYLNITNRCNNRCGFCPKHTTGMVKGHFLILEEEPDFDKIIEAIGDPTNYKEVVFVGFGEPTLRLDMIKKVARWLKERGARTRLDTDGQANLVYGRNIAPELKGLIDSVSVSLNAPDAETYVKLCRPSADKRAYESVKDFIKEAKKAIGDVTATVVGLPDLDIEKCRKIAEDELGVKFRVREYNDVG